MPKNKLNLDPIWELPSFLGKNGTYDQGDTCANYYSIKYVELYKILTVSFKKTTLDVNLITADGWPVRSPDSRKWYGRPKRCSRDQLTPYLCYMSAFSAERFYPLLKTMAKHGFLLANNSIRNFVYENEAEHALKSTKDVAWRPGWKLPDILGPDVWQIWARGLIIRNPLWIFLLLPIVMLGDLQNFLAVLPYVFKPRVGITDERNLALKVHFAAHFLPTGLSKATYKLYGSTKPQEAFTKFWTQPGEPAVHEFMNRLYE